MVIPRGKSELPNWIAIIFSIGKDQGLRTEITSSNQAAMQANLTPETPQKRPGK